MDRKEEIIRLQQQILDQLNHSMKNIGNDLWGAPSQDPFADFTRVPTMPTLDLDESNDGETAPVTPLSADQGDASAKAKKEEKLEQKEAEPEEKPESIEDLKAELNGYIGLDTIKEQVESLINWITINQKRKELGLPTAELSLHMVFSGNPGTGKTMVARLMSRIFKALGILSKGHLVEVDRSGLVAGFVGQTAIKSREVCDSAVGGVLFIDEAYTLTGHGGNDYGQEAVDTILKAMEDHRDDLVVIVAGYIELMDEFIHSNPGLASRFNRYMNFPDYTLDEMMGIFDMRCKKGYKLAEDARDTLRSLIEEKSADVKGFGNARGVRNLFEKAIAAQADRLSALPADTEWTKDLLMTITKEDIIAIGGVCEEEAEAPGETQEDHA